MSADDGGPAFACAACNGHQEGMSLWDYFFAHAPKVPGGYRCKRIPLPKRPRPGDYLENEELCNMAAQWLLEGGWPGRANPKIAAYVGAYDKYTEKLRETENLNALHRIAQWRSEYATMMIRYKREDDASNE